LTWEFVTNYLSREGKPFDFLEASKTAKGAEFLKVIASECDPRLSSTIWIPGDLMSAGNMIYFDKPNIEGVSNFLCPTGFQLKKGANPLSPGAGFDWDIGSETGSIIFRYGEVLLNFAEALWELKNEVAYDQLNLLRERVGMPAFEVHELDESSVIVDYGYEVSPELYEIRRERRIELAVEGLRDEDLMRWAAHKIFKGKRLLGYPYSSDENPEFPESQVNENGLVDFHSNELPDGYQFRENQDYLFPIPQDELTLNDNLDQNPGW